eukprot:COSAG05_NODE_694_length_7891_cov_5.305570_7_plen_226_part_00
MKGNDAGLEEVNWYASGVTDAEVEGLAEAMRGNTVMQTVVLYGNRGVTGASMEALKVGLKESGVVGVLLDNTAVSEGEQRAVREICEANETKWEQAQAEGPEPEPQPEAQPQAQPQADDELAIFLRSCGLQKYAAVMAAEDITMQLLPQLDDTSLGLLGFNIGEKMTFQQVRYLYCLRCGKWIMNMVFCSMSSLNVNPVPPPRLLYNNNLNLNQINNQKMNIIIL